MKSCEKKRTKINKKQKMALVLQPNRASSFVEKWNALPWDASLSEIARDQINKDFEGFLQAKKDDGKEEPLNEKFPFRTAFFEKYLIELKTGKRNTDELFLDIENAISNLHNPDVANIATKLLEASLYSKSIRFQYVGLHALESALVTNEEDIWDDIASKLGLKRLAVGNGDFDDELASLLESTNLNQDLPPSNNDEVMESLFAIEEETKKADEEKKRNAAEGLRIIQQALQQNAGQNAGKNAGRRKQPNIPQPAFQLEEEEEEKKIKPVFAPIDEAFGGGAQRKVIYCGMNPNNKPKNSVWGTRLECYRKGYFYGKRAAHTGS